MQRTINSQTFKNMILTSAKILELNRSKIDALNVFPVPDGDTGTNMSLTLDSAAKEVALCSGIKMAEIVDACTKGALRGARGNSGVILSQILRGICSFIKDIDEVDVKTFANAMAEGAKVAYSAVSKPKEGTILTVVRMMAEHALSIRNKVRDFETFFQEIITKGNEAVAITPTLLPVLKQAGVVDAGGKGLMCIMDGFLKVILGETVDFSQIADINNSPSEEVMANADIIALDDIKFAYCTEFFIININKMTTLADISSLKEKLMEIGDCVIVVGDLEFVKVHVHTNRPGRALSYALELGELDKVKIENMLEQNRALKKKYQAEKKEMGMVAVSCGDGLTDIFKDLMVDEIVGGGQSMNPSANDIAEAVQKVNAENVFIFPNNKNIILAAEQAKSLVNNKTLHVIPSKDIPEGFAAAMAFNPEVSAEENKVNMFHAIDTVSVCQVTYAVRNTNIDGFSLKAGDVIGLDNKRILSKGDKLEDVTVQLIDNIRRGESLITLYYGKDVKEDEANRLVDILKAKYPDADVDVHYGGQPIYYYIIALE